MKKVIFIVKTIEIGGLENYLLRFIKYANNRLDSTVLCNAGKSGTLEDAYRKENAKIILFKLGFFSLLDYWKLYKYLKKEKFDSICDFTGDFSGAVLLTAKFAGIRNRLVFYRGSEYQFIPTNIKKRFILVFLF